MNTVHIGVVRVTLWIAGARSLKDRRGVVVSLRDRLRSRFSVSCHEIVRGEDASRAELLVTTGGADAATVRSALDKIAAFVYAQGGYTVLDLQAQVAAWAGGEADRAVGWSDVRAGEAP